MNTIQKLNLSDLVNLFAHNRAHLIEDGKMFSKYFKTTLKATSIELKYEHTDSQGYIHDFEYNFDLSDLEDYQLKEGVFTFTAITGNEINLAFTSSEYLYNACYVSPSLKTFISVCIVDI